jgi:hypothetical protein
MTRTSQSAGGYLKWAVVDGATGKVVRDSGPGWIRNLILNAGLNGIASRAWVSSFEYAICGTGVRPTSVDSLTTNATLAAGTISTDASFFDPSDVGAELKWDDGTRALISSYLNSTTVSTASTASASGHFVKYNTQDTALQIETKRTNTKLTGAGNCGTTQVGNQFQFRRTFDFTIEIAAQNYTEIGFSWTNTGASTTFARVLLPAPVFVDIGQQLRVTYELRVTLNPGSPISRSAAISGWTGTTGVEQAQLALLGTVDTNGSSQIYGFLTSEPFNTGGSNWGVFLSPNAAAPATFGSCVNRHTNAGYADTVTRASYTANSFYVDATAVFNVGTANRVDQRSFGYGYHAPNNFFAASSTAYVFVLDSNQIKDNSHTLTLVFRSSWSRDLA